MTGVLFLPNHCRASKSFLCFQLHSLQPGDFTASPSGRVAGGQRSCAPLPSPEISTGGLGPGSPTPCGFSSWAQLISPVPSPPQSLQQALPRETRQPPTSLPSSSGAGGGRNDVLTSVGKERSRESQRRGPSAPHRLGLCLPLWVGSREDRPTAGEGPGYHLAAPTPGAGSDLGRQSGQFF